MANHRVIEQTLISLRDLLGAHLRSVGAPDLLVESSSDPSCPRLHLTSVHTFEHRPLGDEIRRDRALDDGSEVREFLPPPVPLTLQFVVEPPAEPLMAARVCGAILEFIQENPIVPRDRLRGDHLRGPNEHLRLALVQLSELDVAARRRNLDLRFGPSISFEVRVELHSDKVLRTERPVRTRIGRFGAKDNGGTKTPPPRPHGDMVREEF